MFTPLILLAAIGTGSEPMGYLEQASHTILANGTIRPGYVRKSWFGPSGYRTEEWNGARCETISIETPTHSWFIYPQAGRCTGGPRQKDAGYETFGETTRKLHLFTSKSAPREDFKGDWRYAWRQKEMHAGCMLSLAHDEEWIFRPDEALPLVKRHTAKFKDATQESKLRKLRLGEPVSAALLRPPLGLGQILPQQWHKYELEITIEVVTDAKRYGWTKKETWRRSDGPKETVTQFSSEYVDAKGELTRFGPKESKEPARQSHPLANLGCEPMWRYARTRGKDVLLGMKAERLEIKSAASLDWDMWVVDHPLLGTIPLKRIMRNDGTTTTAEVTLLRVGKKIRSRA